MGYLYDLVTSCPAVKSINETTKEKYQGLKRLFAFNSCLQSLVTNLVLQVSRLNTKVEDFSFENRLLARTVDLQQVILTHYQNKLTILCSDQDHQDV